MPFKDSPRPSSLKPKDGTRLSLRRGSRIITASAASAFFYNERRQARTTIIEEKGGVGVGVLLNDEAMSHGQEWHIRKRLFPHIQGCCVRRGQTSEVALKERLLLYRWSKWQPVPKLKQLFSAVIFSSFYLSLSKEPLLLVSITRVVGWNEQQSVISSRTSINLTTFIYLSIYLSFQLCIHSFIHRSNYEPLIPPSNSTFQRTSNYLAVHQSICSSIIMRTKWRFE